MNAHFAALGAALVMLLPLVACGTSDSSGGAATQRGGQRRQRLRVYGARRFGRRGHRLWHAAHQVLCRMVRWAGCVGLRLRTQDRGRVLPRLLGA